MKATALLLASALLLSAAGAFAQSFALSAPEPDLRELVGCHSAAAAPAPGSVTYVGMVSSHDAGHEQFARLRQVFAATRPTLVLFEKPDLGTDSTEAATIDRLGETGYARLLARQHQVPAQRLDDPAAEYDYLRTQLAPAPLELYCVLRETQRFRARTGAPAELAVRYARQLLASRTFAQPGTGPALTSLAGLQAAYRAQCPAGGRWWQATAAPAGPAASGTGAAFMAAIDHDVRAFNARHLAQQVATAVAQGQRVLVVLDPAHLPAAPATVAVQAHSRH